MKIGLTHTGNPDKHKNYLAWLQANEDIEIVTLSAKNDNLHALADCHALVLSGGRDIHPKFYGSNRLDYAKAEPFDIQKDEFEIAAFNLAMQEQLPVLGICRGLQLINSITGGSLVQDLGETLDEVHVGGPDKLHRVAIEPGTLLDTIIGEASVEVNSAHHQAIAAPGQGIRINSRAGDGTIEGIEWAEPGGKPFLLAVQWHPERMHTLKMGDSRVPDRIRDRFIAETKAALSRSQNKGG